jgi:predicted oxidoreductase (fatty acid repression mutant protein)
LLIFVGLQVLFLVDPEPVKKLQSQYALYAHHFPGWATQSAAMSQYHLWTALEAEGCGANLQHYNPIVSFFELFSNLEKQ